MVSKKSHTAINIISWISVVGIGIGTMALVIVLSAFNGLSDLVLSLYNSFDPDISITVKQGKTFTADTKEFEQVKNLDGIAFYNEALEGNALLKREDKQCIATIKGVSKGFGKMSGFDTLVREGTYNLEKNNVVMGRGIGYILQTRTNDFFTPVSVYAPKRGKVNSLNPEDGLNEVKVFPAGEFSINDEFDDKYVIMNIERARALLDYTNEVSAIELKLKPNADKEKVQQQIMALIGDKYYVKNREQQNAMLYKTMKSEKFWTFIILVFILIIATFNVIGSLTMLIIEKKKDILILNYLGADEVLIRRIFLTEGILITVIGALSGLILGLIICWLQIKFSLIKLSGGYVVDAYPIKINPVDLVEILGVVMIIGLAAAWYPVRIFTKRHIVNVV